MKNIFKLSLMGIAFLSGCATNTTSNNSAEVTKAPAPMTAITPVQSGVVTRRLNDCIVRTNQSADALLVDSQIIVVTRNNPHAKALFNSADKLTDQQIIALRSYLAEANTCRPVATEGLSPELTLIYQEFFKKIDGVYADLIARKITIGVANQERQLLIQDARMKRLAVQSKKS
ncbi:hypothetical protein FD967_04410 [Polynucleobacter sp. JS-Mosq-20-D10]|uniref:hypothetical protein n=1 Tax=Polynucleobacter sp. JS-Mosq-20-D10 TaxID=2576922 RepID=UPI001BFD8C69|nr:hypothetical protein [Polynucleobacter sp. JS-Mosq-20-D10]QWE01281.1 hypothetical protein FD967_04410 [Polynucleobacter sp. JS-Mosq-20-D10]